MVGVYRHAPGVQLTPAGNEANGNNAFCPSLRKKNLVPFATLVSEIFGFLDFSENIVSGHLYL
jgi:hypothetical protein